MPCRSAVRTATQSYPQTEREHHVLGDEDDACGGRKGNQNLLVREAVLCNLIEEGGDAERGEGREGVGLVGERREEVQHVEGINDDLIGDGRLALADALLQKSETLRELQLQEGEGGADELQHRGLQRAQHRRRLLHDDF